MITKQSGIINKAQKESRAVPGSFGLLSVMLIILCFFMLITGCGRKVYSDAGKEELERFVRLGIFPAGTGSEVNEQINRLNAVLALEKLIGAGSEDRTGDYFRSIYHSESIDFFANANGTKAGPDDNVSAAEAYEMCLKTLGYSKDIDTGTPETVNSISKSAGFGRLSGNGLIKSSKITYGEYSLILSDLMMLRVKDTGEPVYRILAMMDSSFSDLLKYNGLYDDIPVSLCPAFDFGIYVPGSFSSAVSNERREWAASYADTADEDVAAYRTLLENNGWILEGQYVTEDDAPSTILLFYKEEASSADGEAAVVLKISADGTVLWQLLA